MKPINITVQAGKAAANILVDGEDLCTVYGTNWKRKYERIKEALETQHLLKNAESITLNSHISKLRK